MDIRTFGKDFERYFERSRTEGGIIYRPSMVSAVKQLQRTKNLITTYVGEDGRLREEEFDLVALSVGLGPLEEAAQLASRLGIELNSYGFCRRSTLLPNQTSRVGIFVGGAFAEPKDIPETVAEVASAAASAARFLGPSRGSLSGEREYPPLRDVSYEEPKIGVFVCRCGTEITDVINVTSVISHVGGLKNVALARGISKACTAEGIEEIGRSIIEKELNRLVVAGCSHRLYEAPLHACLRSAGLSPHLLERVNLLGECAWVHRHNPIAATTKAQALVSMGVAKASLLDPAQRAKEPLIQSGLVIGGGLAGMTASLSLAEQGFQVYLVEKESELGGNLRHIHYLLSDSNPQRYLSDLVAEVERNNLITVYRRATVENISGPLGQYKATIFLAEENKRVYLDHGTIIVATGAHEAQPEEYLYGKHARVITQRELERRLAKGDKDILATKRVAMIQCVGSRDEEHPYCSRVCCGQTVKNALRIKESSPLCDVFVIYRDIRTYGFMEDYYRRAREAGVLFMRYDSEQKPQVSPEGGMVSVLTRDSALGGELTINADWLVLSTGMIPNDNDALAKLLNVPLNEDGFFLEANPKSPLDFSRAGIYLCGLAHAPKLAAESICQANGAAMRAAIVLGKGYVEGPLAVATVDEELCCGCGLCVEICPYGARELDESVRRIAQVDEILCRGCGLCAAICRNSASQQKAFKAKQVMDMLDAAWG
jgi:heterodisulfide reductase subunit A